MRFVIFICLCLLIAGCASGPETIVQDRVITVTPPVIHDTVRVDQVTDSIVVATKVIQHDTVAIVKYYPKYKYIDYKVIPDTIKIHTEKQTILKKESTPLLSKLGLVLVGIIVALIARVLINKNI